MLDSPIKVNQFLVNYSRMLLADIPDERMTEQPLPGVNHPAWILGHLASTADFVVAQLGGEKVLPATWATLFGPGSKPSASRGDYPSGDELVRAFEQGYQQLRQKAAAASPEQLAKPPTNPRAKEMFPTLQDLVAFLLTGHVGGHLGQLSAWRRMIGLPPLF
jgi:hypothetical protein